MQITFTNEEQAELSRAATADGKLQAELVHDLTIAGLDARTSTG
jgi:hypothetical protein